MCLHTVQKMEAKCICKRISRLNVSVLLIEMWLLLTCSNTFFFLSFFLVCNLSFRYENYLKSIHNFPESSDLCP